MINSVIINKKDNVIVVIEPIQKGKEITYKRNDNTLVTVTAIDNIQIYHKVAITDIAKGQFVVKYGQHIGVAASDIKTGQHVHEHNVESRREQLGKLV